MRLLEEPSHRTGRRSRIERPEHGVQRAVDEIGKRDSPHPCAEIERGGLPDHPARADRSRNHD